MHKRLHAEWEKQKFILLAYPHKDTDWNEYLDEVLVDYDNFVLSIAKYQNVILLKNPNQIINENISNHQNIQIVEYLTNDTWCRDFGVISIQKNNQTKYIDFVFNSWGDKFESTLDNLANQHLYKQNIIDNIKSIDFILEGGSIESNGNGVLLTTTKCLLNDNRNKDLSKEDIESKLKSTLGIDKILWLEHGFLIGDDTDSHIDMLARFVSEDTIAYVKCEDKNDIHYEELSKMEQELIAFEKYNLIPLPMPKEQTFNNHRLPLSYANFLITNKAVFVPQYNDKNDKKAIEVLENIYPQKDIVGIKSDLFIRQSGSLHCLSMQVI
jgi:agmatine/peptidylarginine deiminase